MERDGELWPHMQLGVLPNACIGRVAAAGDSRGQSGHLDCQATCSCSSPQRCPDHFLAWLAVISQQALQGSHAALGGVLVEETGLGQGPGIELGGPQLCPSARLGLAAHLVQEGCVACWGKGEWGRQARRQERRRRR